MDKKTLTRRIRFERPEPPEGFDGRIDRLLDRLTREEIPMKRRYRLSTVVLAAALAALLLAGAALAARELDLFRLNERYDNPIRPLEGAAELVETALGRAEDDLATLTVEEAVCDGGSVMALLRVAAKDPERYVLFCDALDKTPEDEYIVETVPHDGVETRRVTGRRDGRVILNYWPGLTVDGFDMDSFDDERQEDDSVLIWVKARPDGGEESFAGESGGDAGTAACEARVTLWVNGSEDRATLAVPFMIARGGGETRIALVPADDGLERFRVLRGVVTFTPIAGYVTLDYAYEETPDEPMGVDLRFYDAEGVRLGDGDSTECVELGDGVFRFTGQIQSFPAVPETLYIEAKVIGEDRVLGRVACHLDGNGDMSLPTMETPAVRETFAVIRPEDGWTRPPLKLLSAVIRSSGETLIHYAADLSGEEAVADWTILDGDGVPYRIMGSTAGSQRLIDEGERGWLSVALRLSDERLASAMEAGDPVPVTLEARLPGMEEPLRFAGRLAPMTFTSTRPGDGPDINGTMAEMRLLLPVDPARVFVDADGGYYHTRPSCRCVNPRGVTLEAAREAGRRPCPYCCAEE